MYLGSSRCGDNITDCYPTYISDPKHWVFFMCSNISQTHGIRILITCWAICEARRKAIYDGIFQSPSSTMVTINRLIDELNTVESFQMNGKCNQQPKLKSRHRIPPGNGRCKNKYRFLRVLPKERLESYLRDDQGYLIAASALVIPNITEPETLEGMTCVEALY